MCDIPVLTKQEDQLTTMLQYNSVKDMWTHFTGSGLPGQGQPGPSPVSTDRFFIFQFYVHGDKDLHRSFEFLFHCLNIELYVCVCALDKHKPRHSPVSTCRAFLFFRP